VVPVLDRNSRREFLDFPYRHYRDDAYWVPPLRIAQKELFDTRKHPFYAHAEMQCFLARQGGRTAGRIAAILDRNFNQFHNEEAGFFGFFETVNDLQVAAALLREVRDWLLQRGVKVIRGPVNPSTNYECGLLIQGFDSSPYVMMTYNPPYYAQLIEQTGLRKAKDLYAYHVHEDQLLRARVEQVADRAFQTNQVHIRPIRMKHFQADVELVWKVYNLAWSRNWGFVPMSRDEFFFMARDMKTIIEPELVLLGEVDGQVVGFALALPDVNRALIHARGRLFPLGLFKILYHKRTIRTVRVIALGVLEKFRSAGVGAGFYAELIRRGLPLGYRDGEMSWVLEDNILMCRSAELLGGKRYKTYRIYEWD